MSDNKAAAQAWKKRWELVKEREIEELRRQTPDEKLAQLWALIMAAREMGWNERLQQEEDEVRTKWMKMRAKYAAQRDNQRND